MITVRVAAARVLAAIEAGRTTLGAETAAVRDAVPARDWPLLVELTSGALRWRGELDAYLAAASQRAVSEIDPRVLAVLRVGAYQICHLDRVPAHAVVHESVDAVRSLRVSSAAGFVNAVLRALLRRRHAIHLPKRPDPGAPRDRQLAYLSTTLSHPRWLVERWLDRVGFDATERWCRFNDTAPSLTVRPIDGRTIEAWIDELTQHGIEAVRTTYVPDALQLGPGAYGALTPEQRAHLMVQDEGSQLVARMVGARPGERILDACAAPGGKTAVMAAAQGGDGVLIAADGRESRTSLLVATLARAGAKVPVLRIDARGPLPFGPIFDAVLLDAPCSGLGTLRRDPDIKWTRQAADLPAFAAEQARMLRACATVVRPGGRLVYATCSSEPEENAAVVQRFLEETAEFATDRTPPASIAPDLLTSEGWLATSPAAHGLEAFFAAVLARRRAA